MTERQYHVDGELCPATEATVSVRDRGFMYGDAAFETLRIYGGTPFEWESHCKRLFESCETLGFASAVPAADTLRDRLDQTLVANECTDAYAKLSVSRGVQPGKLTPSEPVDPTVVIIVSELPRGGVAGRRVWDRPAEITISESQSIPDAAIPSGVKTHTYLDGILARQEIRETRFDEAIRRSADGFLTEGATSNLFFLDGETLLTPTDELPLLPGITRRVVIEIAENAGIGVETGAYEPGRLRTASEAFLTNSTWEIRPVTGIGDRSLSVGSVTEKLQGLFDDRVETLYTESG